MRNKLPDLSHNLIPPQSNAISRVGISLKSHRRTDAVRVYASIPLGFSEVVRCSPITRTTEKMTDIVTRFAVRTSFSIRYAAIRQSHLPISMRTDIYIWNQPDVMEIVIEITLSLKDHLPASMGQNTLPSEAMTSQTMNPTLNQRISQPMLCD